MFAVAAPPPATPGATKVPAPPREFTEGAVDHERSETTKTTQPTSTSAKPASTPSVSAGVPSPSVAELGRLLVRSTPSGARVFVDGRDRGRAPTVIRDLARGEHRVRLVHEGYATDERRIVITASRSPQSMSVTLAGTRAAERASPPISGGQTGAPPVAGRKTSPPIAGRSGPATSGGTLGSLSVDSRPAGAKVFIDDKPVGVTPIVLSQIGAGDHVVRLEQAGYRQWSSSVRIVAGERNRVTASLEEK